MRNYFLASRNDQVRSLVIYVLSVIISPFPPLPLVTDIIHLYFFFHSVSEASLPCSKSAVFMQHPHQGTLYCHRICTKHCLVCFRVGLVA